MSQNSTQIKIVDSKDEWETFLLAQDLPPFLQSWNAAEQANRLGEKTLKLGIYKEDTLKGVCLIHLVKAKRGNYLFAPYGPVLKTYHKHLLEELTSYLKQWGRSEGYDFIRIAPYFVRDNFISKDFSALGYRVAPIHMLSEIVWSLPLENSTEDDLLMGMRKTTRNLIRRAMKEGVIVKKTTSKSDVETFASLMKTTKDRHNFVPYPDTMYYEQVECFKPDNQVVIFTAEYQGEPLASAIVMYYGNAASYHHGASIPSKIPAAYLLQWEAIKEAKVRGCKEYSFWGIDDSENPKHPFYGISRFKKGFGGTVRYLIPAMDYPLTRKYWFNYAIETARRIKRGFGLKRT